MGVHGLWRLIDPSGKVVPLETLENKVLAVDLSIWLHQAIKGFRDSSGGPVPNAHLLAIYHRVCKLLYYKIKPVFVFDGGVPNLKKETIAKRNQLKSKNVGEVNKIQKKLLSTLLKHSAVNKVLSERTKNNLGTTTTKLSKQNEDDDDDIFKLPPSQLEEDVSSSSEEEYSSYSYTDESTTDTSPNKSWDIYTIDVNGKEFKSLPADVRYEILTDLKETRKQSSWGRIHEMPTHSDDFSSYQMGRLLKRQSIQSSLEEAEKEMGGHSLSLGELEDLLTDQGVLSKKKDLGSRIAKDEQTRYLYIKDIKKAIEDAKQIEEKKGLEKIEEEIAETKIESEPSDKPIVSEADSTVDNTESHDNEYERDLAFAIQLSLQSEPSTSKQNECPEKIDDGIDSSSTSAECTEPIKKKKLSEMSFLENFTDADFMSDESEGGEGDEDREIGSNILNSAKNYMIEYSNLTPAEIAKIMGKNDGDKGRNMIGKGNIQKLSEKINAKSANTVYESTKVDDNIKIDSSKKILNVSKQEAINLAVPAISVEDVKSSVEVMSDSDESDDFVEVKVDEKKETTPVKTEEKPLEVFVDPSTTVEDDIFADIFGEPEEKKPVLKEKIEKNIISKTQEKQANDVPREDCKTVSEHFASKTSQETTALQQQKQLEKDELKEEEKETEKKQQISTKQLEEMRKDLLEEERELASERASKERMATNLTDQMYQEAQDLLELFGVPYIIAPMEAEAQCAFLEQIELTDGTITDDSDIWLFGGKTVYKNFFNQNKHVLEFRSENIHHHFKLTRYQLILLALLVGSDYTTGLQGVGPVTALEILASFPHSLKNTQITLNHDELVSGLESFKVWYRKGPSAVPARSGLRTKLKNVVISETFPSMQVVQAYLQPSVDVSDERFSWSKPDIAGLKIFAREKFGWTSLKSDEILKPVIKRMEENRTQSSIKDFFKVNQKFISHEAESKMSKRVQSAVKKMGRNGSSDEDEKETEKPKRRTKRPAKKDQNKESSPPQEGESEAVPSKKTKLDDSDKPKRKPRARKATANQKQDGANKEDDIETSFNTKLPSAEGEGTEKKVEETRKEKRKTTAKKMSKVSQEIREVDQEAKPSTSTKKNPPTKKSSKEILSYEELLEKQSRMKTNLTKDMEKSKKKPKGKFPYFKNVEDEKKLPPELAKAVKLLNATKVRSQKKVQEIDMEVKREVDRAVAHQSTKEPAQAIVKRLTTGLNQKEYIHQKEKGRTDMLRNKLKAIETFRKSKQGPGYVKKRSKVVRAPKEDAELSESSDES